MSNLFLKRSKKIFKYLKLTSSVNPQKRVKAYALRKKLRKRFSYAIPNKRAIEKICELSPIVEIGAGNGYWANLVENNGGKVVCYDKKPNPKKNGYSDRNSAFHNIKRGDESSVKLHSNKTLFLCWPDDFNQESGWSDKVLKNYIDSGGNKIITITEGKGGAAGCDNFFEILETKTMRTDLIEIPTFPNLKDFLEVRGVL